MNTLGPWEDYPTHPYYQNTPPAVREAELLKRAARANWVSPTNTVDD